MAETPVKGSKATSTKTTPIQQISDAGEAAADTAKPAVQQPPATAPPPPQPAAKGWRFWAVFPPLSVATLLVGLDSTIGSSALPKITADLNSGDNYVWILNGYLLTS